ncbi:MAG: ATP-binding cassette domain-containing protein, partial [Desulfomonilaceae bacterium]
PIYRDLKVIEYLDFIGEIRGFSKAERKRKIERAMTLCDLTPVAFRTIDKLSKGYRQRVGLAQAILHDPGTLILDEPTSGLDPNQIVEIRNLVRSLGKEKTVILSTHILQEVEIMCRNVLILNEGLIVANGTAKEIGSTISGKRTVVTITLEGVSQIDLDAALQDLPKGCNPGKLELLEGRVSLEISVEDQSRESLISEWAIGHRFHLVGMVTKSMDLEEIFRILTQPEKNNA